MEGVAVGQVAGVMPKRTSWQPCTGTSATARSCPPSWIGQVPRRSSSAAVEGRLRRLLPDGADGGRNGPGADGIAVGGSLDGEPALRKEDEVLRAKASRARRALFSKPLDLAAEKADLLSTLITSAGDVVREAAERGRVGLVVSS